ncbi:MAG: Hsp33 family molecular chaperone HslO [Bacillota bacterium]|nr:MAG: Hsp33 family molecular chaperone HslO [Bacillota bacterium]
MNRLVKTLIYGGEMSLCVMDTTDLVNDAIRIHKLSPLSAAALGRVLTAATFMSSGLKNDGDKLSVNIVGDGVGGPVTVSGNSALDMRGTIDNPRAELPLRADGKLDVGGCIGKNGRLTVVKSMGLKEPYSGSCRLVSGEVAEDFAAYYLYSEQQPSAIALGVKIGKDYTCAGAGGVVIQALPDASEQSIAKAEEVMKKFSSISTLIKEKSIEEIIEENFGECKLEEFTPRYRCLCSRDYIGGILKSMGKKELDDIVAEQGKITVNCEFCERNYEFTQSDVDLLFEE